MEIPNSELSVQQLVGYLISENSKVSENQMTMKESHSESLARYYDCISGWNPVW